MPHLSMEIEPDFSRPLTSKVSAAVASAVRALAGMNDVPVKTAAIATAMNARFISSPCISIVLINYFKHELNRGLKRTVFFVQRMARVPAAIKQNSVRNYGIG